MLLIFKQQFPYVIDLQSGPKNIIKRARASRSEETYFQIFSIWFHIKAKKNKKPELSKKWWLLLRKG